jgi:L-ascorbate metabolism protein UlaG (beta-lactamase superfamily)
VAGRDGKGVADEGSEIAFRWLGVAGIELRAGGQVLIVDPYLTRLPFWRMWFGRAVPDRALIARTIPHCDWILVTHAHWDHLMDVPDLAQNSRASVAGSPNTCRLLAICGVPEGQIREVEAGGRLMLGAYTVEVLPAEHMPMPGFGPGRLRRHLRPPLRPLDYRMDVALSFRVSVDGLRLLTDPGQDPQAGLPAEVLFVAPGKATGHYAALLSQVRPKVVVPTHWDDPFRPLSQPLQPYWTPPRWAIPPLRRVDLASFRRMIEGLGGGTVVLLPEALHTYSLAEVLHTGPGE